MNSITKQYLQQVRKNLICPYSQKRRFLRQLASELDTYCENTPEFTLDALWNAFGTPEDVANDFLSEMGPAKLSGAALRRNRCIYTILGVLLVALVLSIWVYTDAQKNQGEKTAPAAFMEHITIIEDDDYKTALYLQSDFGPQYWEYDRATNTWTNKPKPEGSIIQISSFGEFHSVRPEGELIIWKYDPTTNTWTETTQTSEDALVVLTKDTVVDRYYMYSKKHGPQYWEYNRETNSWENLPKPEGLDIELCYFMEVTYLTVPGHYVQFSYDAEENQWNYREKME